MKIRTGFAAIAVAMLVLAGCSSAPDEPAAAPSVEPATTPTPSPTPTPSQPATSDRGNLVKAVGDTFGFSGESGESMASFVVTALTVDPECTSEYAEAPEHGHFVRLDLQGETTAELTGDVYFAGGTWFAIAENGTTFNGDPWSLAAASCMNDTERFPNIVGPGERVQGAVILDVPSPHGVIIWELEPGIGWEWTY